MHYQWQLFLNEEQLSIKMVHEHAWYELKLLQLRFTLCELIDCSKWQRCPWRLEMGGREVFSHNDRPHIMRPWMKREVTGTPGRFTIYLHNEEAVGDQFCSSEFSFCIPMEMLFASLESRNVEPDPPKPKPDAKCLSKSMCDIGKVNARDSREQRTVGGKACHNSGCAADMGKGAAFTCPLPATQLGSSVTSMARPDQPGKGVLRPPRTAEKPRPTGTSDPAPPLIGAYTVDPGSMTCTPGHSNEDPKAANVSCPRLPTLQSARTGNKADDGVCTLL